MYDFSISTKDIIAFGVAIFAAGVVAGVGIAWFILEKAVGA